jgi:prepilin-type N-terminal cleavage/methylation domain-containing protein
VSRSLADRLRRRAHGDEGFSLVEIMIAMVIFGIVTIATAPLFVGGLKAGRASQLYQQAKSLSQERLEKMRNLPYHVARQNGQYLDVLDIYFRDLQATGALATGDTCSQRVYTAATSSYRCTITNLGADYAGFSQDVTTQFVNADRAAVVPFSTYSSQTAGYDQPVSNLLSVTVVTKWRQASKNRSFTLRSYIANAQADPNVINTTLRASALKISSNLSSGDILQFEGGLISSEGALNTGSTASLSVVAAQGGRSSGTSVLGAQLSLSAPPSADGTSPTANGLFLDGSTCGYLCFGNTMVTGDQKVTVDSGFPKVSVSSNPVTATLRRAATGLYQGFSYNNATPSEVDPALSLDTSAQMVSATLAAGGTDILSGAGYIDATGTGSTAVRSSATVKTNELDLFPTTFISGGRPLVRAFLTQATLTCSSGAGSSGVSASWEGKVGYWSSTINDYVYYEIGPGKAALPAPSSLMVQPGVPLSTWVQAWSSLTSSTGVNQSANRQAKGTMNPVLSILTAPTRTGDATSPLNIAVGSLACLAEDNR